jgi:YD repeat-containing protein
MNLANKNIISRPIEVVNGIIDGVSKVYTGSELILYKPISTPLSISAPYRKLSLQIPYPVSNYSFANVLNDDLIYDTRMSLISEFEYSNLLRLNKITEVGQLPINYTWDSKMLYPTQVTQGEFKDTYTYKPLVGMLSSTNPRGVTTYYEYDTFNRLKQTYIIENGEKKILQKYDYHYATQQQ